MFGKSQRHSYQEVDAGGSFWKEEMARQPLLLLHICFLAFPSGLVMMAP
jgi:hypothetical protein